jgi:hypothetical protein
VNFVNDTALSQTQKQHLLDHNALDLSDPKDSIGKKIHIFPQSNLEKFLNNMRTHNANKEHIMGDISGLNVELDTPSLLPASTNPVNLDEHKTYPFTQKSGKMEFTFWGDNNDAAYQGALKKEARQDILSKTICIDKHDYQRLCHFIRR